MSQDLTDPSAEPNTDPIAIARELIRCRSVTPDEGGALTYLLRLLTDAGFDAEIVRFSEDGTDDVDNLYARIGSGGPHLTFAGHTDVVPAGEESRWTHPPFAAEIAGGALYGRGAVDMKGAVACFAAAVLDFLKTEGTPKGSISFLITGDEEGVSINGTRKLLAWAKERGERFDHALVGEPTNPNRLGDMIKIGRRGSLSGTITITGKQGHSAYPHLANNPTRGLEKVLHALYAEPLDSGTHEFDPSTLEVTSVDTGNPAFNVIPAQVRLNFNSRFNNLHTAKSLQVLIEKHVASALEGTGLTGRVAFVPNAAEAFLTEAGDIAALLSETIEAETGRKPDYSTTGGTSDARYIKDYCPVIEFGLVGQTMHQVDEHVAIADLKALTAIYRRFLTRYFERFGG
ncbi:succinyl-diaminopimelate desuccinylase [Microbaculum marinisediminis]|uniref:Succinyl-diaminopimelate desuccinylase n=1 Tax=Microbaculum marinisediminis TaxID=2931392 RepID=A0AAW5QTL8_9HYPH|nr:succinyl-diaminopimelate desuccinylase [Microbaculum sp. A6E488]MCT8970824.1 succinyl-diaminopimelate desuccinylase [Microbaculum sp. A6E488]